MNQEKRNQTHVDKSTLLNLFELYQNHLNGIEHQQFKHTRETIFVIKCNDPKKIRHEM